MPTDDQRVTSAEGDAAFFGFVIIATILYFTIVWDELPSGSARWVITGVLVAVVVVLRLISTRWRWLSSRLEKRLKSIRGWSDVSRDFMLFVVVIALALMAALYLAVEDKILLLKVFAVFYFSLLPALLYLQFSSRKKLTVWREYCLNLYKLGVDDPANLPRPPALSPFYSDWKSARDAAWAERRLTAPPGESREQVDERLEYSNLYRQKFRDLFGRIPPLEDEVSLLSLRSTHKLQVVVATILITIGWIFVVQPESVFGRSVVPSDFELVNLPPVPRQSFAFAFLGAYFYILQMLVRRYFQSDLKSTAYLNATMRIIIVILLVWVIDPLLAEAGANAATRSAVAFVIGVFPNAGWRLLQLSVRKPIGMVVDSLEPKHKLGHLDGLNIWYESRLLEVGVEDMQNLATTDIVDLMLNTRIPVDRIVDWIDQAFLYLRVGESGRATLRSYGVRHATDLLDLMSSPHAEEYKHILDATDKEPSRMVALVATLEHERNFQHVKAWKAHHHEEGEQARASQKSEATPAVVPTPA